MPIFVEIPKAPIWLAAANQRQFRLIFFGTPEFAIPALNALFASRLSPLAVVTAPDKPIGRKKLLTPPPVKQWAIENDIKIFQPATLKDDTAFEQFSALKPDVCIVSAYGNIIPSRYLKVPKFGFVNIHPSLLPAYRGPTPIQSVILNGETRTGVTIMQVDAEIDHGPILAQETYDIPAGAYLPQVENDLAVLGAELLVATLKTLPTPHEQDHSKATFTKKFTREDGHINWHEPAEAIHNRIRALATEPGTWTMWSRPELPEGKNAPLNILEASCAVSEDVLPPSGTVVRHHDDIAVATGNGFLVLHTVQLSGSRLMLATAFAHGHPNFIGTVLL